MAAGSQDEEEARESWSERDSDSDYVDSEREDISNSDQWTSEDEDDDNHESGASEEVRVAARDLIKLDPCERKCLRRKVVELEQFYTSIASFTTKEKKTSLMTVLATLIAQRQDRVKGDADDRERRRFAYVLPMVGEVCRESFCAAYDVSTPTIARYRARVEDGAFDLKKHGNAGNQFAKVLDDDWLARWIREFAAVVGDVVPVRVRRQTREGGRVIKTVTHENNILFPSYFTWEKLHEEMLLRIAESMVRRAEPSEATFRLAVQRLCPEIGIRSPRDNVCDACVIYKNQMKVGNITDVAELMGRHTEEARRMRLEYKEDFSKASDDFLVLTMDYAQNLVLPHVAETPSQWYFLSLVSVSVFGIHSATTNNQTNYVYTERKGGKGSTEVISMLHAFIQPEESERDLTIYADNCGGQNKNNYVVKYLLFLTHAGYFKTVNYKFFIRGHTKNACDRGFGTMKKKLARSDCWNLQQLKECLNASSSTAKTVMLDDNISPFCQYKPALDEMYKNLPAIQRYQIFSMSAATPGVVVCRESPTSPPLSYDLRKSYDNVRVTPDRGVQLIDEAPCLPLPKANPEKVRDIYTNVRPYVPAEFRDDPLYAAPDDDQLAAAKEIKKQRVKTAAKKKLAAAQEHRGEPDDRGRSTRAAAVGMTAASLTRRSQKRKKKTDSSEEDSE